MNLFDLAYTCIFSMRLSWAGDHGFDFRMTVTVQQVPRVLGEAFRFAPVVAKQAPPEPGNVK